jgi:hypothetical protein
MFIEKQVSFGLEDDSVLMYLYIYISTITVSGKGNIYYTSIFTDKQTYILYNQQLKTTSFNTNAYVLYLAAVANLNQANICCISERTNFWVS